jgi:hypothetical protein
VTEPLVASAFRAHRVQVRYEPKVDGVVRLLTPGLARWGAPDVEVQRVPSAASARMGLVVLAVAQALADGAPGGPLPVSLADAGPVSIDLVSAHPENGDPNDFMARIEPPGGEGVVPSLELVERFFGPTLAVAAEEDAMVALRGQAQAKLGAALAKWSAARAARPGGGAPGSAATLLVRLPFPIPGDAGVESMWVEVTRYDAQTVTGKLVDEPLGATDVARGDDVTRPRSEVESVDLRSAREN